MEDLPISVEIKEVVKQLLNGEATEVDEAQYLLSTCSFHCWDILAVTLFSTCMEVGDCVSGFSDGDDGSHH